MDNNPIRVLLIEDDLDDVLLLKESLAEARAVRIKLTHADRLSEGLKRIAEQEVDVILLDLNLPDSRGLDTLKVLLRQVSSIPIVVLSGLADDLTTLEAVRQGAQDFLVKGEINGPMLVRILRYAIERKQIEKSLRASEARNQALLNAIPDLIFRFRHDGTYIDYKAENSQDLFLPPDAFLGKKVSEVLPQKVAEPFMAVIRATLETSRLQSLEYQLIIQNEPRCFEARFVTDGLDEVVAISRNITKRKQAEEEIQRLFLDAQRRAQNLEALRQIDNAMLNTLDLKVSLPMILSHIQASLVVDAADILLLDPYSYTLSFAAGRGFRGKNIERSNLRLGEEYGGRAVLEKRMVSITNLSGKSAQFARAPLLANEGFVTYFGMPLIAKGQVKGVLEVFHRAPFNPNQEWLDFFELMAGQTAITVDSINLFTELANSNAQLFLAYDSTIEGWSHALDLRDKETEGHTQRVTEMTMKLAGAAGVTEEELVHVRRGALLHDIGKMGVPDHILFKPDKLTDEEWIAMRKHPVFAYEMLSRIAYLHPALDIPYCHHEKWDGSGYPRGLKGEQIPLAARLFAVVDVWDALRSDRPYRQSWPKEKVIEYIKSLSGTHFDPKAVELFLNMMSEKKEA